MLPVSVPYVCVCLDSQRVERNSKAISQYSVNGTCSCWKQKGGGGGGGGGKGGIEAGLPSNYI